MLPMPVTVTVVLVLTALLGWNVIVVGPEGYPTTIILGGLLGGYAGVNQLLKGKSKGGDEQ